MYRPEANSYFHRNKSMTSVAVSAQSEGKCIMGPARMASWTAFRGARTNNASLAVV